MTATADHDAEIAAVPAPLRRRAAYTRSTWSACGPRSL